MNQYPLFPLSQLLFPEQEMSLKIFEPRYLAMISRCLKEDTTFGVVLIREGREVGQPPLIFQIGVQARIVDWNQLPGGLLGITVRGERKFRVLSSEINDDKLMLADVNWLEEEPSQEIPDHFDGLVALLGQLCEHPAVQGLNLPRAQDSRMLGWQLTQLLPMNLPDRVALLGMNDPLQRLQQLAHLVERLSGEEDDND